MVRAKGLEPPHLSILEPKSSASTNSATPARTLEAARPITAGPVEQPDPAPRRSLPEENLFDAATIIAGTTRPAGHANPEPRAFATPSAEPRAGRGAGTESEHRRTFPSHAGNPATDHPDLTGGLISGGSSLPEPRSGNARRLNLPGPAHRRCLPASA